MFASTAAAPGITATEAICDAGNTNVHCIPAISLPPGSNDSGIVTVDRGAPDPCPNASTGSAHPKAGSSSSFTATTHHNLEKTDIRV